MAWRIRTQRRRWGRFSKATWTALGRISSPACARAPIGARCSSGRVGFSRVVGQPMTDPQIEKAVRMTGLYSFVRVGGAVRLSGVRPKAPDIRPDCDWELSGRTDDVCAHRAHEGIEPS